MEDHNAEGLTPECESEKLRTRRGYFSYKQDENNEIETTEDLKMKKQIPNNLSKKGKNWQRYTIITQLNKMKKTKS